MKKLLMAVFAAAIAIQAHSADLSPDAKSSQQPPGAQANGAEVKSSAPVTDKNAPISCFRAAGKLHNTEWSTKDLTVANKIRLCSGAASADAPIGCFRKADAFEWAGKALTAENKARLCGGAEDADAPLNCLKAAEKLTITEWSSTALTLDNKIDLCSGAASAEEPVSCFTAAGKLTGSELDGKALTADNKLKLCGKKPRL